MPGRWMCRRTWAIAGGGAVVLGKEDGEASKTVCVDSRSSTFGPGAVREAYEDIMIRL